MQLPKLRPASARRISGAGFVIAAALVLTGLAFHLLGGGQAGTGARAPSADAPIRDLTALDGTQAERLRALRDEALDCMGWAAGNSFRQPIWPEVESYVGHRGVYYGPIIGLVPPGLPSDLSEAESGANFDRYRGAFLRGRQAAFDAAETRRCIERAIEISGMLERLLEDARDPRTLGSPVSIE